MQIVTINLENEMDLMLAYKRSMKIAELCGLSVLVQTSFATSVSEIARCVIRDKKDKSTLNLSINVGKSNQKELVASIISNTDFDKEYADALRYAKRLSNNARTIKHKNFTEVQFIQQIGLGGLINENKLESFISYFKTEIPLSPYDELRRKNILLLEMSEKLRASENRYKELTKTLPLMIFTTNSLGNLTYGNKWLLDFFKISEIQTDKISWLSFLDPKENKTLKEAWDKAMLSQTRLSTQGRLRAKENEGFLWHLVSITPVKNEENLVISWAGFFVDIHAQKLIEETLKNNEELKGAQKQLLKYQKNLEEKVDELAKSNNDLEQFAYIASHDLQEPLRKIRTFTNLIGKNLHEPEQSAKYLHKIETSSARMVALIKDVLNYSRLIKAENKFANTPLQDTLKSVLLDMELIIEEKKAQISSGPLPIINAVPQQMYQLFYNLIGNGLKFSVGEPRLEISSIRLSANEIKSLPDLHTNFEYVEIIFKDNGIGFDEQYAPQIFTIFKRLNSRDSYPGTGIGLALCKKIVDNHHGLITVKSAIGKGTEFHIILPVE